MRKTLRAMLVAVLTFLSAVALGVASAMTAGHSGCAVRRRRDDVGTGVSVYNDGTVDGVDIGRSEFRSTG
jgi:hypothetical protein